MSLKSKRMKKFRSLRLDEKLEIVIRPTSEAVLVVIVEEEEEAGVGKVGVVYIKRF